MFEAVPFGAQAFCLGSRVLGVEKHVMRCHCWVVLSAWGKCGRGGTRVWEEESLPLTDFRVNG